jgi:SAM-dependent methyltransferase
MLSAANPAALGGLACQSTARCQGIGALRNAGCRPCCGGHAPGVPPTRRSGGKRSRIRWLPRTEAASMGRMPTQPENGAQAADLARVNDYDIIAEAYAAENETSLANAYYERPAILALAGDVAGRRILDAGCGSGPLSVALRDRGAVVTGIDISAGMLELARRKLGDDVRLQQADLKSPLPFPDNAFDDVVAALVLHYLEDWTAPLAELRRVLAPCGRLIVSVNHPSSIYIPRLYPSGHKADYFATHSWTVPWTMGGQTALMRFWHRPLHAMTDAFTGAGFRISVVSEPQPVPAARELFPDQFPALTTSPNFLFFVLHAD